MPRTQHQSETSSYADQGIIFADRLAMRTWLSLQGAQSTGSWLVFGKRGGPHTLTASEALEEALCHGWIDGQMKRIDDLAYVKYFAPRRRGSKWSARNRALVEQLVQQGVVTQAGLDAIESARAEGTWDAPAATPPSADQNLQMDALIRGHERAYAYWLQMSPSVQRTYTRLYFDAKSAPTRARRLARILDRLDRNLKPM